MPTSCLVLIGRLAYTFLNTFETVRHEAIRLAGRLRPTIQSREDTQNNMQDLFDYISEDLKHLDELLDDITKRRNAEQAPLEYIHDDDNVCTICLEALHGDDNPLHWHGVCNHAYHKPCIEEYFNNCSDLTTPRCPQCRISILKEDFDVAGVPHEQTEELWQMCSMTIIHIRLKRDMATNWFSQLQESFTQLLSECRAETFDDFKDTRKRFRHHALSAILAKLSDDCHKLRSEYARYRMKRAGLDTVQAARYLAKVTQQVHAD